MKKRRTKNQKVKAQHEYTYQPTTMVDQVEAVATKSKGEAIKPMTLYGYEPSLLNGDLQKTIWVTGLILALEIGFYFYRLYWGG